MPFINKLIVGQSRGNLLKIGIVVFFVLIAIMAAAFLVPDKKSKTPEAVPSDNAYVDPKSQETISDPPGKSPETFGDDATGQPILTGYWRLLDYGLTAKQLDTVQIALASHLKNLGVQKNEISLTVDSIKVSPPSSAQTTISYETTFGRTTTYNAKISYTRITEVRVQLFDTSGVQKYDSGNLSAVSSAPSENLGEHLAE